MSDSEVPTERKKLRFDFGRVVATVGALAAMVKAKQSPREFIRRHVFGDWGELGIEDKHANEAALELGLRIFSAYRTSDGERIWVITEADRSSTCLLLPEEY